MNLYKNGYGVSNYMPTYNGKKILIGIDSSKSNTAMVVRDEYKQVLDDYEIGGGGSDINVYQLCWDTRKALKILFEGADIIAVGIEDIITKKEKGYQGLEVHQSRAKITAVFDNLIFFFQDNHNLTPLLINNWEWKSHTLPEEFRTADHKKGSKDYFDTIGGRFAGRKDDVTDAACISEYLCDLVKIRPVHKITEALLTQKKYEYAIYPVDTPTGVGMKEFLYNPRLSLTQNIETMISLLEPDDKLGFAKMDIKNLSIHDLYKIPFPMKMGRGCTEIMLAASPLKV